MSISLRTESNGGEETLNNYTQLMNKEGAQVDSSLVTRDRQNCVV